MRVSREFGGRRDEPGKTFAARRADSVYVRLYEEMSRELADAIDTLVERASRVRDGTTTGQE